MAIKTTTTSAKPWAPDISVFHPSDAVPDALILAHSTVAGAIDGDEPVLRVAYVLDDAATVTVEGAEIDEADPGLAEVLVHTAKITQLVRLSNEQYAQAGTAGELAASVRRAIIKRGDQLFLSQPAPTAPATAPSPGLLNVSGIVDGGPVDSNLDGLIDLVAAVAANGATPTGLLIDPVAWASLRKLKTGTGSALGILGAGTNDAEPRLLGLPVTVTGALPEGTGIVLDRTAVVSAVGSVRVATSSDVFFTSDGIALRATWRIGQNVVRPERIGRFTVAAPE